MRRAALPLALLLLASTAFAQPRPRREAAPQPARPTQGVPPHAWLFGVWTGGLFPVLDGMTSQDCKTQPTVVFGRDTVGHSTLLVSGFVQRVIETVRATPAGAEFRFTPNNNVSGGFGCDDPNTLHVARVDANTISLPQCAAFPYPLERCPAA